MMSPARNREARLLGLVMACWVAVPMARGGDEPRAPDSALVRLLKSGRVPEERQPAVIEMIGKRGSAEDLAFLYERALAPSGVSARFRAKVFDALADAVSTRSLRPPRGLDRLITVLQTAPPWSDASVEKSAIRLVGLWKLEAASGALLKIAKLPEADAERRTLALGALAEIGGTVGHRQIESLLGPDQPVGTRLIAIAALAKLDIAAAAGRTADILPQAAAQGQELTSLLAAFLNRQGGSDGLAAALRKHSIPPDAAKLALRAVYALGRADPALVAALGSAAGLATDLTPLTPLELSSLVSEILAQGDPVRGEAVFRRADLNCLSCHALSKAGGDVGPDLSSVGQSSPPDYIVNSILLPDQAIKEQYHTLVVLTSDGQIFQGIVIDKDNQRIVLKEATGAPRIVPVESIVDQKPGGSLMPKGLANLMTRAELIDLVRFLSELGKPGPYAIRAVPAIQRWRVLKAVPAALRSAAPDKEQFQKEVRQAGQERWSTAYARLSGSLPLDDLTAMVGGEVLYVEGAIDVSNGGAVQLDLDFVAGIRLWIDEDRAPADQASWRQTLSAGRHFVTLRVDTKARASHEVRVEVTKPNGSSAEFTVVGGR
jgi:putative heme-binding domain-containing protein